MSAQRLGDRRARTRFEIVGPLWGALERVEPLTVRNISRGGALMESSVALKLDDVHRLRVTHDGHAADVQVRVRHVRVTPRVGARYEVGLEFLTLPDAIASEIDRLVGENRATAAGRS